MKFVSLLIAGAAMFAANSALAATCNKPAPPLAVDGKSATMQQLLEAKNAVTGFINASDAWQTCVLDDLKAKQDAGKAAKMPLDPAVEKAVKADVADNQTAKEHAGQWFNAAVKDYKAAHPS